MVQVMPAVVSVINTKLRGLWLPVGSCLPHAACLCTEQVSVLCPCSKRWTCCHIAAKLLLPFLFGFACDIHCLWVELLGRVACILQCWEHRIAQS